jgi:hypothetical protein
MPSSSFTPCDVVEIFIFLFRNKRKNEREKLEEAHMGMKECKRRLRDEVG